MIFSAFRRSPRVTRTPDGRRAYAIGDIHGRMDLLQSLLGAVEHDIAARPEAENYVVFLGDLIDRGPQSRDVVEYLRTIGPPNFHTVFLLGNHEEIFLRLLKGEGGLLSSWLRFGGAECAASYGLDPHELAHLPQAEALNRLRAAVPQDHADFLESFLDTFRFGDYLFVHAGIRPGIDLASQSQRDLRWIRKPFLDHPRDHGFIVVHGHTVSGQVVERPNRIGIDTGAYATGILTAIGLEGTDRWYLDTNATDTEQTGSLVD